jgi:hypothetical protein
MRITYFKIRNILMMMPEDPIIWTVFADQAGQVDGKGFVQYVT